MKTYQEYLDIIKKRQWDEAEARNKRAEEYKRKWEKENPGKHTYVVGIDGNAPRMTFDYSVEIIGMMMQDFLEEFTSNNFQFDKHGCLYVKQKKR